MCRRSTTTSAHVSPTPAPAPAINGTHVPATLAGQEPRPPPAPPALTSNPNNSNKKATGKAKKTLDSSETSKLLAQRISQLEHDAAGEKDQEAEIEREVKKANRELHSHTSKMSEIQKIEYLTKRCSDLFADMKRHERENIKNKKRADQLQKEKDSARSELTKQNGLKEKLEKLCRELQKENNKLKNECKTLTDNQRRNESSWDEKYSQLLQTLEDYQEDKENPRKQVVDMPLEDLFKARFKSLIDQYELRELHFHSLMRTKELELQFNLAKYDREKKNAEAEAGRARQLNAQVQTFSKTEAELRNQLNVYVDKFKQVEDTLNNSNDLFLTFRKEMEDMSKKTKRLEKENENLKRKHEKMNSNIFKMADERNKHLKDIDDQRKNNEKLKSIITQMQQQGRGIPQGMQGTVESCYNDGEGEVGGEESEYEEDEEEYEEGDEGSEGEEEYEEDDEETEDEGPHPGQQQQHQQQQQQPYGPERPPPPQAAAINGNH
ncbi:myosin-like coiled-coil protein-domain-containing protein [Coniella lustricola]|uniref:Myosin-like coiled-coil protein-domain-containing protein n=1 Tax=Coniella lustricola TaxID=2025994 RepID=A0A2T3AJV9_9PEZI|nr:myosin-like coiled-coil protein-domain-containing protein [Coniella lustricola]